MLLGKIALGFGGTLLLAGAYTFRQGVIRIDVDEHRAGGAHVHVWLPAAAVPAAMHFMPRHHLEHAVRRANEWLPTVRAVVKELEKFPAAELIDVQDNETHAQIRTHNGKLLVDVNESGETVHVACPIATLQDLAEQIQDNTSTI